MRGGEIVSAFAGRGQLNALKMVRKDISCQETFKQLGKSWNLSEELLQKTEQFTCRMYVANSSNDKVNELHYQLFCSKRGDVESI